MKVIFVKLRLQRPSFVEIKSAITVTRKQCISPWILHHITQQYSFVTSLVFLQWDSRRLLMDELKSRHDAAFLMEHLILHSNSCAAVLDTLRTGDANLHFYITTVQDG